MNYFWVLISIVIVLETIADVLFKEWSLKNQPFLLVLGVIIYSLGTVAWAYSLKFESLSKAITVFSIVNLIAVILIGLIFYKEDVSLVAKLGIVLGVISVVLMQVE